MIAHQFFDLLALFFAFLAHFLFTQQWHFKKPPIIAEKHRHNYQLALIIGMFAGSLFFGSLNLYLADIQGLSKSMLGGIAGAILFAESFKKLTKTKGSTGYYFIPSLCLLIIIGRMGCFLDGVVDYTYGLPSQLPWAVDFGDKIKRHPVQLYESMALFVFLSFFLWQHQKSNSFRNQAFYWFILFYGCQRFIWEFLKPYPVIIGNLNLFHLLSLGLIIYALIMLKVAIFNTSFNKFKPLD